MEQRVQALKQKLQEIFDLTGINALLSWDQSTQMPPAGAPARGRQLGIMAGILHERQTDPALGELLDALKPLEASLPFEDDIAALIRVARRNYERATRVPAEFMSEFTNHTTTSYDAWTKARPANDFESVRPLLEKTLAFSRQYAEFFPGYEHIADPLIAESDEGMTAATVRALFDELRGALVPLVQAIGQKPQVDDSCLFRQYPEPLQLRFGNEVITDFGYDFDRGRIDKTHHPFMTKFSLGDVRITTRFKENALSEGIFSSMHEAGHALYEQNIDPNYEGTPLAGGTSSAVHESQSRLWENIVGRSLPFWQKYYPRLQATFPDALGDVDVRTFYKAVNKVSPSLIRTDADEVTYNLHVMIRFDLELAMLEGKLAVADLPEAWNARYQQDLGVTPPSDVDGVLQDVHWYAFFIGGVFQGYTLGNIISLQLYEAALKAHPNIPAEIGQGNFRTLLDWMRENVNTHGKKFDTDELLKRATGRSIHIEPYIRYLNAKYGEIYNLTPQS